MVDRAVFVRQYVAQADDLAPRDFRVRGAELLRHPPRGLAEELHQALQREQRPAIAYERLEREAPAQVPRLVRRLQHVPDVRLIAILRRHRWASGPAGSN